MIKINRLKIFFLSLFIPLSFLWTVSFFYQLEAQPKDISPAKNKAQKEGASNQHFKTTQEQYCPVDQGDEDEYLFIGCNGFF